MRLLRMCESEGRIDFGAYSALKSDLTLGEALELEAALCVAGDQRAEFAEFYQEYKKKELSPNQPADESATQPKVTPEQIRAEIKYRRDMLQRDTERLMRHRTAVGMAASGQPEPPGRLGVKVVQVTEQAIASHKNVIAYLEGQLNGD